MNPRSGRSRSLVPLSLRGSPLRSARGLYPCVQSNQPHQRRPLLRYQVEQLWRTRVVWNVVHRTAEVLSRLMCLYPRLPIAVVLGAETRDRGGDIVKWCGFVDGGRGLSISSGLPRSRSFAARCRNGPPAE